MKNFAKTSPILTSIMAITVIFIIWCIGAANTPDRDLVFVRDVPTSLDAKILDQAMSTIANWPTWHHMLEEAKIIDLRGLEYPAKDQVLTRGELIKFKIENPQKQWKRFELVAELVEYEPRKKVHLRLLKDSTNRITHLFSTLEWTVELMPNPSGQGTLIRGTAIAHTNHWRGRLFGIMAPRILMNQVFYPDLVKLGAVDQELEARRLGKTPGQSQL